MEASALTYKGGIGLQSRAPLLRLQSDERLITLVRRGNPTAFEVLVARYQSRLLAFCRHLLGSREDAEDVLQEVMTAAYNAMIADERPINVRPWLYRIARNRCLNHLRRVQPVGVDSMDVHLSDAGETTADKVHKAEEFRLLVGDIQGLPETQRTALVLREMDALSYEQIAEAMETTVPSVKSLLVRARLSLGEAAEARLLSCEQVRVELAEVAEGLLAKATPSVRRHLRSCQRCSAFQSEMRRTSKALAALLPLGPIALLKQLAITHLSHSAGSGASGAAGTGAAVGGGAAAGGAVVGAGASGMVPIGLGALATKAAAGLAAAALVTAGAVDLSHTSRPRTARHLAAAPQVSSSVPAAPVTPRLTDATAHHVAVPIARHHHAVAQHPASAPAAKAVPVKLTVDKTKIKTKTQTPVPAKDKTKPSKPTKPPGKTESESIPTVLSTPPNGSTGTPSSDGTATSNPPATGSTDPSSTPSGSTGGTTQPTDPTLLPPITVVMPPDPVVTPSDPAGTPTNDPSTSGDPSGAPAGSGPTGSGPTGDPAPSGATSPGSGTAG